MADIPREQQLERALRRLLTATRLTLDTLDLDPAECVISVSAQSPTGHRSMATFSLAAIFAEAERLIGQEGKTADG